MTHSSNEVVEKLNAYIFKAATESVGYAVERIFDILKHISLILNREPMVIHLPAIPDRQRQLFQLDELSSQTAARSSVVLISTFPDAEIIRWPHNGWEVYIMRDGTIRSRGFAQACPVESN